MTKISVIIPVYNTEKYLKECLESIINQTLTDIEIICINDGSTDNSLDILNSYANSDKRIKVFSQKNQGQGTARNYGMKIATGDYIHFMDSDDILELNTFEDSYRICEEKNLDFIFFKLTNYDDEKEKYYNDEHYTMSKLHEKVGDTIFNYKDLDDLIFNIAVMPCNKLYNHDFIKKFDIKFPENLIFEDNIFFWNVLLNAKRVLFHDKYLYTRRRHGSSTIGSGSKKFIDTIKINNLIIDTFKNYGLFEQYKNKLYNRKVSTIYTRFTQIKEEFKNLFFEEMKKDFVKTLEEDNNFIDSLNKRNKKIFETITSINDSQECLLIIEHYDLLNKNKSLKKKQKKMKKQIKKYNKENKIILNSNSWKITKPLRIIGSFRGKNMTFTEKILQHSNSYNFYKGGYKKLTKNDKKNKQEIKKLKKQLENKDKQLKNKEKEYNDLKILNSELKNYLNQINNSLNSLTQNFNQYKNTDYNNSLFSKEVRYALVFKDTAKECKWFNNTSFSLNNGAANYSFMYTLFRILDEVNPQNILELGLGQTTKLTTQYTNFFKDSKLITVDGDQSWIDVFSEKLTCEGNISIVQQDTEKFTYNETENLRYKDLSNIVKEDKFDLIIIDGPNGFFPETGELLTYSRSNIWNLLDNNLAEDFVIIIDDYERLGEKNTMNRVEELLNEKGIEFYTFKSIGLKEQYVICSEKYKFISWF